MAQLNAAAASQPPERRTLTVTETARELGISRAAAYAAVHAGAIPVVRIGRRMVVPQAALDRLLACWPQDN